MKKLIFLIPMFILFACEEENQKQEKFLDSNGVPIPTSYYVNDFTNNKMLDTAQVGRLNSRLKTYEDSTTNQIVVICLPKLPKNSSGSTWSIEELALNTLRTWKIGQKDTNNGVLLLIAFEDKKFRIETGYGVEGALPDITCKHILDEDMEPLFKDEKYYKGIDKAITSMQKALAGEYTAEREARITNEKFWVWFAIGIGVCALIGAILRLWLAALLGGLFGALYWYSHSQEVASTIVVAIICAIAAFVTAFIFRLLVTGDLGSSGGYSGGGGWSSSGGGSGGGGFSGGGGGGGGGGASGGW